MSAGRKLASSISYDRALATIRAAHLYDRAEDGHVVAECPLCGQAMRVDKRPGGTARFRCYAGTAEDEIVGELLVLAGHHRIAPDGMFQLLTAEDLLALPAPSWLIDGLLPASGLSVLYGARKSGKSFVALDWALSVATGLPWLGHEVDRRPVVYVAAEGRAGLGARYRAWSKSHGGPDASGIRFLPETVNLRDRDQVERARSTLAALPERPGLIVVDTMARSMVGGEENSAKDIGEFIAVVDLLRGDDAALVVHHTGKDGGSERGSSALAGAADLLARLERDGLSPRLTLSCDALKEFAEWNPLLLQLEEAAEARVISLCVEAIEQRDDLRELILAAVVRRGPISGNAVADAIGKRKADVLKALRALREVGRVEKTQHGYVPVPVAPEPAGNGWPGASSGGGSAEGETPVGGPQREPPRAPPAPDDGSPPRGEGASSASSNGRPRRALFASNGAPAEEPVQPKVSKEAVERLARLLDEGGDGGTALTPTLLTAILAATGGDEAAAFRLARRWQATLDDAAVRADRIRHQVAKAGCSCVRMAEPTNDGRCSRCYRRARKAAS